MALTIDREIFEFILPVLVAMCCGMVIGFERQWNQKSAGLKTNTLVATGSAIYVSLSLYISVENGGDVTRIIGQVVTGIGFLGAGIIFREGFNVHGLTTAATVWCSSAIGCIAAVGLYSEALLSTGIILFINIILSPIDNYLRKRRSE